MNRRTIGGFVLSGGRRIRFLILLLSIFFRVPVQAGIRHVPVPHGAPPESLNVWVFFTDKPGVTPAGTGAPKASSGKHIAGTLWSAAISQPVSSAYILQVQSYGGTLRHCFKWDNAASFRLPATAVRAVRKLSCVKEVTLVGRCRRRYGGTDGGIAKLFRTGATGYGSSFNQLTMLRIPEAHRYLSLLGRQAAPGEGVRLAFFDSGFRLDHRCLRHLLQRGAVVASRDFIDHDTSVADPDSVAENPGHPLWGNDHHGTEVLSIVAALDTPWYCGAAWGAEFLLARTEDVYYDSATGLEHELHTEEDNWAAAVVWAESLGVDIISSSVGYRYDFQDTVIIDRGEGIADTVVDYLKSDLDGKTTVVSRAARYAVERGILVVNAVGNERADGDTSLNAPADVDGVIAVGAINPNGTLAYFSSLGPSADGRIKPDLVAPGTSIYLPDVLNPGRIDYSHTSSRTSYATPLIAGVCALMQQAHPSLDVDRLRNNLFAYCRLLPGQVGPDNAYGRGIPDAVRSCMTDENEVFLAALDTGGIPLQGVSVVDAAGDTVGTTTSDGTVRFTGDSSLTVVVFRAVGRERRIPVTLFPFYKEVYPCSLVVRVVDAAARPVKAATATVRSESHSWTVTGDTLGIVRVTAFFPASVAVTVSKAGYSQSDTLHVALGDTGVERTVVVQASERPFFEVYPTVVRKTRNERLRIRFAPVEGVPEQRIHISIRSFTGTSVWETATVSDGTPVELIWQIRAPGGGRIAPGTYFLLLSCDERRYRKKFIIAE